MQPNKFFSHAQQRARERYRADLLPEELARMAVEIEQGRSTCVRKAWGGREIHLVHCPKANQHVPVVYDPNAFNRIITLLPEESRQFGTMPRAGKRMRKFREVDLEDAADDAGEGAMSPDAIAALKPPAPNNVLAEALEKALREAGLGPLLGQSSPSKD